MTPPRIDFAEPQYWHLKFNAVVPVDGRRRLRVKKVRFMIIGWPSVSRPIVHSLN